MTAKKNKKNNCCYIPVIKTMSTLQLEKILRYVDLHIIHMRNVDLWSYL